MQASYCKVKETSPRVLQAKEKEIKNYGSNQEKDQEVIYY